MVKNINIITGTPLIRSPQGRISLTFLAGCGLGQRGVSDEKETGRTGLVAESRY
jgi:hypothetical protein